MNINQEWSDKGIQKLADVVVIKSLKEVSDNLNNIDSQETISWILSQNTTAFSFIWCCKQVGLNHEILQTQIEQML